jgi:hypothetical protein
MVCAREQNLVSASDRKSEYGRRYRQAHKEQSHLKDDGTVNYWKFVPAHLKDADPSTYLCTHCGSVMTLAFRKGVKTRNRNKFLASASASNCSSSRSSLASESYASSSATTSMYSALKSSIFLKRHQNLLFLKQCL